MSKFETGKLYELQYEILTTKFILPNIRDTKIDIGEIVLCTKVQKANNSHYLLCSFLYKSNIVNTYVLISQQDKIFKVIS